MSVFTLEICEAKVRELINDTVKTHLQIETYNPSSVFVLDEENIIDVLAVYKNDVEQLPASWSYNEETGKVTISFLASYGDSISFSVSYYEKYSSGEIQNFIKRALVELGINKFEDYIVEDDSIYYDEVLESGEEYTEILTPERNLISMIAAILIKPENKSYRLPDFQVTIQNAKSTSIIIRDIINRYKKDKNGIFATEDDEERIIEDREEE